MERAVRSDVVLHGEELFIHVAKSEKERNRKVSESASEKRKEECTYTRSCCRSAWLLLL